MKRFLIVTVVLLTVCAVAQQKPAPKAASPKPAQKKPAVAAAPSAPSSAISETKALGFVRALLGYNPDIQYKFLGAQKAELPGFTEVNVMLVAPQGQQMFKFLVVPSGDYALVGDVTSMPFSIDPFAPARTKLQRADGPSRGPKDAKVKLVEFADLQCPSCKLAQPTIQKLFAEKPGIEVVFQNFPLSAIHKWARRSAEYVDCLNRTQPDIATKFIDTVFENQEQVNETNADEKLKEYASQVGAAPDKIAACIADPKTNERIDASYRLGEELGVTGTPTVFINGRRVANFNSVPYEVLTQLVDYAEQQAK